MICTDTDHCVDVLSAIKKVRFWGAPTHADIIGF